MLRDSAAQWVPRLEGAMEALSAEAEAEDAAEGSE
jgi:hypothetical protein